MKLLIEYNLTEYIILLISMFFIIIIIYYIIPGINLYYKLKLKEKEKQKKALLLKQIVMQKDINEEIENELNMH
ncbi:hypothetical protein ACFLY2_00960 [Patescibacteria group bacterium]